MRARPYGRLARLFCAIVALVPLAVPMGCGSGSGGGGGGGTPSLGLSRVSVDESRAGKATIGPEGGVVTATSSDGIVYTLTIPKDAILDPTEVKLYPVSKIASLPFDGGLAAGVHFTPEGLQL